MSTTQNIDPAETIALGETSNAVFISDHVRDGFKAVTAAESLRD